MADAPNELEYAIERAIMAELSLMRIFGSYAEYVRSLTRRAWEHGANGWVSDPR